MTTWNAKDLKTEPTRGDEHISVHPVSFKPVKGTYRLRLTVKRGVIWIASILRLKD